MGALRPNLRVRWPVPSYKGVDENRGAHLSHRALIECWQLKESHVRDPGWPQVGGRGTKERTCCWISQGSPGKQANRICRKRLAREIVDQLSAGWGLGQLLV